MKGIHPHSSHVTRLDRNDGRFRAALDDGSVLTAERVLLALGFPSFAHIPDDLAALLAEAGATAVDVCHRHETPAFVTSDWSWIGPLLDRMADEPGWYRGLSDAERESLNTRFWSEGRLKLEPWLAPRLRHEAIRVRPKRRVVGCEERAGALRLRLETGETFEVDHLLFATEYKVDLLISFRPEKRFRKVLDNICDAIRQSALALP